MPKSSSNAPSANAAYRDDLAFIHDSGFGGFMTKSVPWLLETFRSQHVVEGKVVDLGCGSGIWAKALVEAGYDVLGIDISAGMLAIARTRAPAATFRQGSFVTAPLPSCVAVTALGEILGYLFDRQNTIRRLELLFRRVYAALCPGGLFVFDVALPGRVIGGHSRHFALGDDWACLHESEEDRERRRLTRHITTFRKVGELYRRDHEVHRLRLYDRAELVARLRKTGFRVRTLTAYGQMRFPVGYAGFLAHKPGTMKR